MIAFGDIEPEDSWDPDDPVAELLDNLLRRLVLFGMFRGDDEDEMTVKELVDRIGRGIAAVRQRRNLTPRDHVRIGQLDDDLDHIEGRIR